MMDLMVKEFKGFFYFYIFSVGIYFKIVLLYLILNVFINYFGFLNFVVVIVGIGMYL